MAKGEDVSYEINYQNTPLDVMYGQDYQFYNIHTVKRWLKDHNRHNRELRRLSNYLYNADGVYTNVIDYTVALPTLDRIIHSRNSNHKRYKVNKDKFSKALEKVREKTVIRDMLYKSAIDGTSFYYFDSSKPQASPKYLTDTEIDQIVEINDEFNCSIIPLPTDYCRLIGTKNMSPEVAFDCSYFDQFVSNGLSLKLKRYPKEIRSAYRRSEEHTSELQSRGHLVCRLLL